MCRVLPGKCHSHQVIDRRIRACLSHEFIVLNAENFRSLVVGAKEHHILIAKFFLPLIEMNRRLDLIALPAISAFSPYGSVENDLFVNRNAEFPSHLRLLFISHIPQFLISRKADSQIATFLCTKSGLVNSLIIISADAKMIDSIEVEVVTSSNVVSYKLQGNTVPGIQIFLVFILEM